MRPTRRLLRLVAPVLALVACGTEDLAPSVDPTPPVDTPTAPLIGTYEVTSRFEVPATVVAPGPLGDALRLVHGLADDPGTALLDLAENAGVPAIGELRMVLPDSELAGWMNRYLETATVDGVSPHARIVELDDLVRSVLLRFELRSRLALPSDAAGTHVAVALAFGSPADPIVIPLDATAPITAGVGVTGALSWPDGPQGAATATLGDHAMGLPFGRYALQALDEILLERYGAPDVVSFLSGAVGCPALAASVASRCVGFVCVGHGAELLAVCDAGVAEGAEQLESRILAYDFQAIRFERGTAVAGGASLSPPSDPTSLSEGVWTATIDAGNGAEEATATFSAVR